MDAIYNDQGQILVCEPTRPHMHHASLYYPRKRLHVIVLHPTLRHHPHHKRMCHAHVRCHWVDDLGGPAGEEGFGEGYPYEEFSTELGGFSEGGFGGGFGGGVGGFFIPSFFVPAFFAPALFVTPLVGALPEFTAVTPSGGAVPEVSTWLMSLMGFGVMTYIALDKRAKCAIVRN